MQPEILAWLIPLPPILAFFLIILWAYRNNRLSHSIAVGSMLISWGLAMVLFWVAIKAEDLGHHPIVSSIPWLPTGETSLHFGILIDPLSVVTLFFVAWTCLAIFLYSVGYHNFGKKRDPDDRPGLPPKAGGIEPMYARFFAFISLFAFGMLTLVVSDNLLLLFIGWEIMGLCSYLLIGFWYGKPSARDAMVKAFITTRIGDVLMLLGLAYLYSVTGTLNFRDILFDEHVLHTLAETPSIIGGLSTAGLIGILLFFGTVGKSAQWPLHVWLPDAMEGPTPVSAMIHAATMVSAGVYLVLRFFPLLTAGWHEGASLTPTMLLIAGVGAFTALFAATIAVAQVDIKRVLAYSTISQLGYMIAAVGIGAFVAGAFHLITHAFFKALLFLGSGSVIHGMEHGVHHTHEHVDAQDMFNMGGLRRKMPITFWTFLIGGFALSGFPLVTAGFWSKDEILADAYGHGYLLVFITLALAALLTAFYTMRQISLTFLGQPRTDAAKHAHESVWTMTLPLVVLAVFAVGIGWVGIPEHFPLVGGIIPNWFHDYVGGTLIEHPHALDFNPVPLLVSIGVALGGLTMGWLVYRRVPAGVPDPLQRWLGPIYTVLKNKYYFDELYHFLFVRPAYWFAETFTYRWIDRGLIDGFLHAVGRAALRVGSFLRNAIDLPIVNGLADRFSEGVKWAGRTFRVIQTGRVQEYLIIGLVFTGLLLSYFLLAQP
ncbi:MAG: NADH-quinone oxidoreductase subunit L [Anaerolineaceae bacterium]|nr:MAG: NADH-quinone oxidoreductase subunit L [Anaerolineaceae bacterium]